MNEEELGKPYQTLPHRAASASDCFQSQGFPDHGVVSLRGNLIPTFIQPTLEPMREKQRRKMRIHFSNSVLSKPSEEISSQHLSSLTLEPTRKSRGGGWGFTLPVQCSSPSQALFARGIWGEGQASLFLGSWGSQVTHPCDLAPWHHGWSLHEVPWPRGDGRLQGVAEILGFNLQKSKELWN